MIQLCKACTEQPVCCVNLSECAGQRYRAVRSVSQRQWGGQRRCCGAEMETKVTSQLVAVKGRTAEQCVEQTLDLLHPSHLSSLHIHRESSVGLLVFSFSHSWTCWEESPKFNVRFTSGTRRKGPGHLFVLLIVQYDSVAGSKWGLYSAGYWMEHWPFQTTILYYQWDQAVQQK